MLTANVQPMKQWPRIRRLKPGVLQVKGRCVPIGRWLLLRRVGRLLWLCLVLVGLAAVFLPYLMQLRFSVAAGETPGALLDALAAFRFWWRDLFTSDFPAVGRAVAYTGSNPVDFHLLAVVLVVYAAGKRGMPYALAALLAAVLFPVVSRGFKVSFSPQTVKIHRLFRPLQLQRHMSTGGEVAFRCAGPEYQKGLLGLMIRTGKIQQGHLGSELDFAQVQAVVGLRPIGIITPRRRMDAESIIQSFQLAMQHSRNT